MHREEHITFINTNLIKIMREVVSATSLLGDGMELYAAQGYLLQSLFLQITGAQEQKMKCICWEIATNNLRYRIERYYRGWSLSECSTLADKNVVYKDLLGQIHKIDSGYSPYPDAASKIILRDSILNQLTNVFNGSNLAKIHNKEYESFKTIFGSLDPSNFLPSEKLLFTNGDKDHPLNVSRSTEMFAIYSLLYTHRNRCAHNTPSYQLNIPRLSELKDDIYQKYNNIFLFFAALLLIDEVFRTTFSYYQGLLEEN